MLFQRLSDIYIWDAHSLSEMNSEAKKKKILSDGAYVFRGERDGEEVNGNGRR